MRVLVAAALVVLVALPVFAKQPSTCSDGDYLTPRLEAGGRGRVTPGGAANRVRVEPDTGADLVGVIEPETEFDVLEGPVCDAENTIVWWRVKTADLEGWTAEGLPPDEYFLEPVVVLPPTNTATPRPTPLPTATFTPAALPELTLPELEVITAENISQLEVLGQLPAPRGLISPLMSPDGEVLVIPRVDTIGYEFGTVYTFPALDVIAQDIRIERERGRRHNNGLYNEGTVFTPDGDLMVVVLSSDKVVFYRPGETPSVVDPLPDLQLHTAFDVSENGLLALGAVWTADDRSDLCFIDSSGAEPLCIPQTTTVESVAFLPGGEQLLSATVEGLTLYDVQTGEVLETYPYRIRRGGTMALLPDGTVLMSKDEFVLSVNLETGVERTYPNGVGHIAIDIQPKRDGSQMMIVARQEGTSPYSLFVYDVPARKLIFQTNLFISDFAEYSPDQSLAYIHRSIYDTTTWKVVYEMGGTYHDLHFSPDQRLLIAPESSDWEYRLMGIPKE